MFDELRVAKYRFTLQAGEKGLELPEWKASTFRGGFGHVFKRLSCIHPGNECAACPASSYCAYTYVFETRPTDQDSFMGKYDQVPRPYILEVPLDKQTWYDPGDFITIDLILFGGAIHYAPLFVSTFRELGKDGIGIGRKTYLLVHVENRDEQFGKHKLVYINGEHQIIHRPMVLTGQDILEKARDELGRKSGKVIVFFVTPLRLKWQGSYTDDPQFHFLIRNLFRRLTGLLQFHHDFSPEWNIRDLLERAEKIKLIRKSIKWVDHNRYSARQDTKMKIGGITGWAMYEGEVEEFSPWLRAAEVVHLGKNTVFDLGRVRVST